MKPDHPPRTKLSEGTYALLGLLTFGEMSGYDLIKLANRSIASFFKVPSKAQVYAELRRLTELGHTDQREVIQSGRPNKRLYKLTPQGQAALEDWLESSDPEPFGGVFLLQLMFGRQMRPETAEDRVRAMQDMAREEIGELRSNKERLGGSEEHLFPSLLVAGRIAMLEACIGWADDVLVLLAERSRARS